MKPSWKDAPEWAQWLAMDEDDEWYWFEREPVMGRNGIWRADGGRLAFADKTAPAIIKEPRP